MPRPERVLYASFLRLLRLFRSERVPLTGVVGSGIVVTDGRPINRLRRLFRQPFDTSSEGGLRLLSALQTQLDTLVACEEETREALAEWDRLLAGQAQVAGQPAAAALAAERGMQLLVEQSTRLDELFSGGLAFNQGGAGEERTDGDSGSSSYAGEGEPQPATLDSLAAEVRERCMQLALAGGGSLAMPGSADAAATAAMEDPLLKAKALSEVLYGRHRYRHRPFEWVYDGLRPLLLPEVLTRRQGAPLALAVLAAAVGRRAGLALTPVPADPEGAGAASSSVEQGPAGVLLGVADQAILDQLPPHLASKLTSSAQGALPPMQPRWLLRIERGEPEAALVAVAAAPGEQRAGAPNAGQRQTQEPTAEGWHYLDASTGEILGPREATEKYPGIRMGELGSAETRPGALKVWQSLVRTIIQAHQRRGESDLVAHWVYVLLGLDPQAEEWRFMLQHGTGCSGRGRSHGWAPPG